MKLQRKNLGQGMTEYLIIVALIAVSSIAITRITSNSVKVGFGKVANALQGVKGKASNLEKVNQTDTEGKSMNDFNAGAVK